MKLPLSALIPNVDNPRLIKDDKFDKLVKSIQDFPQMLELRPIVVDEDYTILGGNMRYKALKHLGHTEVEVTVAKGLSDQQKKEFVIKDNSGFGEWDWDIIANEWSHLPLTDWGVNLPEDWIKQEPAGEEGEFDPTPPVEPISVLGDLYELNAHRVHCASSTEADVVNKTLNGVIPILMVTDPPYGVEYDPNWRNEADRANGKSYSERAIGKVENDHQVDWTPAYSLFPGQVVYVWHAGRHAKEVAQNIEDCNFDIVCQIIWAKSNFAISRGDYHWKHEPCWYAVKKGKTHNWQGDRSQTTLWEINKPQKSETGHGTQKPVECMAKPIENNTAAGESVYDPFLGSGTTLIACEQLSRTCYGQELSPAYVDVIVKRYIKYMSGNNRPFTIRRNGIELSTTEIEKFHVPGSHT